MFTNRFLGVTRPLPNEEATYYKRSADTGRVSDVFIWPTTQLPKFAFPGGYEIYYLFEDMESVCADCANRILDERAESLAINRASDHYCWPDDLTDRVAIQGLYDSSERLIGWQSMDCQDSCEFCAECGRGILASGCEEETDQGISHGEYCQYRAEPSAHLDRSVSSLEGPALNPDEEV